MDVEIVPLIHRKHYPLMAKWWKQRKFKGASLDFCPDKGFFAYIDGRPIMGAFLIETNANLAILDYASSDPSATAEERDAAFDAVFKALFTLAGGLGYKMISAASKLDSVNARYEKYGLFKAEENVTIYGGFTCHKLQ